ncbi:MAG: preprotein translocase subunit YajC [Bacteroides sp.]|nr:preprotein translocase subunit YajC [Bacteroides sp.]MCM1412778.1 preprotein translocase subunit YajC [Bacteroides sp.]
MQGGGFESLIMIVLLIVVFYFFMIRPQQKRQKQIRNFREGLQQGDRVVTAGGIYGKVRQIKENTFVIEIANGVNITIDKNSVYPSADVASEQNEAQQK